MIDLTLIKQFLWAIIFTEAAIAALGVIVLIAVLWWMGDEWVTTTDEELRSSIGALLRRHKAEYYTAKKTGVNAESHTNIGVSLTRTPFDDYLDGDAALDQIMQLIHQDRQALISRIEAEVIGENIEQVQDSDVLYAAGVAANAIRNDQRQALATLISTQNYKVQTDNSIEAIKQQLTGGKNNG